AAIIASPCVGSAAFTESEIPTNARSNVNTPTEIRIGLATNTSRACYRNPKYARPLYRNGAVPISCGEFTCRLELRALVFVSLWHHKRVRPITKFRPSSFRRWLPGE